MSTEKTLAEDTLDLHGVDSTTTKEISYDPVDQTELALADIKDGLNKWQVWLMLAYQDIKLRYRRSVLGPFWLTLSMGITVYTMGYIYSHIFHVELANYFPFLTAGMLGWALLSTVVIELTDSLINSEMLIKQIKLPYTLYIHRIICRNIIIFFHNLVVLIPIILYYHDTAMVNIYTLLLIPGLAITYLNALTFGTILAMIGARYRDISQIVKSLVQVVFFMTPVMWRPEALAAKNPYIVKLNPFASFLEILRAPLLGKVPAMHDIKYVCLMSVAGAMLSWMLFRKRRARIVYWL